MRPALGLWVDAVGATCCNTVKPYEANTPKRPWHSTPDWLPSATGDELAAAMDKLGVDGSILISAFSIYCYDASYAVEVQKKHPGRFALVKPVDPDDPAAVEQIAEWKKQPGARGIRVIVTTEPGRNPTDVGLDRVLREAVRQDFPVNILCWGNLGRLQGQGDCRVRPHHDCRVRPHQKDIIIKLLGDLFAGFFAVDLTCLPIDTIIVIRLVDR